MSGEILIQKTELFTLFTGSTAQKILNITDGGSFGPQSDDIDSTNWDSVAMEFLTGLPNNGEMTLAINLKPLDTVHQAMAANAGNGVRYPWCLCLSDGTVAPTVVTTVLTAPAASARTSYSFLASIKSFQEAFKKNDIDRVNCVLKLSGGITRVWHT